MVECRLCSTFNKKKKKNHEFEYDRHNKNAVLKTSNHHAQ